MSQRHRLFNHRAATAMDLKESDLTHLINLAGRQRMLSQRLVLHLCMAARKHKGSLKKATEAYEAFCRNNQYLRSIPLKLPATSPLTQVFQDNQHASALIDRFIQQAQEALQSFDGTDTVTQERHLVPLLDQESQLLDALEHLTNTFQKEVHLIQTAIREQLENDKAELIEMLERVSQASLQFTLVSLNARVLAAKQDQGRHQAFTVVAQQMTELACHINDVIKQVLQRIHTA